VAENTTGFYLFLSQRRENETSPKLPRYMSGKLSITFPRYESALYLNYFIKAVNL
jgi:hypothetical protein